MDRRANRTALCILAIVSLAMIAGARIASAATPADLKGKPAPDFSLDTINGKHAKLADLKGKVVVIDFWATWCPPCRASLPHIQKLATDKGAFDKGLRVLAINAKEDKGTIEQFLKSNNFTFVVPMDSDGSAMHAYNVRGIPTTMVIGRDGTVVAAAVGWDGSGKKVDDAVKAALQAE